MFIKLLRKTFITNISFETILILPKITQSSSKKDCSHSVSQPMVQCWSRHQGLSGKHVFFLLSIEYKIKNENTVAQPVLLQATLCIIM